MAYEVIHIMSDKNRFRHHEYEGIFSSYEEAEIVIYGVPFDGTCSNKPGTRFGPAAIRSEIDGLETYSPYLNKDLLDTPYCEIGDIDLPLGNTEKVVETIYQHASTCLQDNKRLITLGGEHLVTYPVVKAYAEYYDHLHVVHLDAHADLRDDYLGEKLSHATVMRRVFEQLDSGILMQFGIRSGTREEFKFAEKYTTMQPFTLEGMEKVKTVVGDDPVYLSIDLDVLDPSIFPGTGTPEPGGIPFNGLIMGLTQLLGVNIVGADIMELSPHYDPSGVSNVVGAKILREVALMMSNYKEKNHE